MSLTSKEHYELMSQFEKDFSGDHRLDREKDKALWAKGHVYECGKANEIFLAYRRGHAYGQALARQDAQPA